MHTQSKYVSMFDSETIVQYLCISCTRATEVVRYCLVEIHDAISK